MKLSILGSLSITLIVGVCFALTEITKKKPEERTESKGIIYTLPPLPYTYNALEPYIDARTMEIHYTKHHQKYVDELNKALKEAPLKVRQTPLEELLKNLELVPAHIRMAVRNNGGGHYNHSFFWKIMTPKSTKKTLGKVKCLIDATFKSFDTFKEKFDQAAAKEFGSGWAWLCVDKGNNLVIMTTNNQDCPLTVGLIPILGLDVWEHAYYLKYQNRRPDYVGAWWNVVNWQQVEDNYKAAVETHAAENARMTPAKACAAL